MLKISKQILILWVKLMIKKFSKFFFQCLALPKDPQSFCPYVVKAKKKYLQNFSNFFFIILKLCKDFTQNFFSKKSNWKWVKQSSTFFSSFGGPQGNRTSVHAYCLVLKAYLWRLLYPLPIGIFWKILHFWNIWIIHME